MKLTKYIATALAGMALVACGNDYRDIQGDVKIEYNTLPDVVVNLAEPTVTVNENTGLFTVPVYVQGNRNGYVTVTIECVETGNDPAIAGRHYLLTSDNINIAQDDEEGEFELSTIDFRGLDPNRTFDVKIIASRVLPSASRQRLSSPSTTRVLLRSSRIFPVLTSSRRTPTIRVKA